MNISFAILCLLFCGLSALAVFIPLYLIPVVIRRAPKWGILDAPDARKIHSGKIDAVRHTANP